MFSGRLLYWFWLPLWSWSSCVVVLHCRTPPMRLTCTPLWFRSCAQSSKRDISSLLNPKHCHICPFPVSDALTNMLLRPNLQRWRTRFRRISTACNFNFSATKARSANSGIPWEYMSYNDSADLQIVVLHSLPMADIEMAEVLGNSTDFSWGNLRLLFRANLISFLYIRDLNFIFNNQLE